MTTNLLRRSNTDNPHPCKHQSVQRNPLACRMRHQRPSNSNTCEESRESRTVRLTCDVCSQQKPCALPHPTTDPQEVHIFRPTRAYKIISSRHNPDNHYPPQTPLHACGRSVHHPWAPQDTPAHPPLPNHARPQGSMAWFTAPSCRTSGPKYAHAATGRLPDTTRIRPQHP